jgi:hypothetical protein
MPELPSKGQRLTVVLLSLVVLTGNSPDLTQPHEHEDFTGAVPELPSKSQRLTVVLMSLVVLTGNPLSLA